MTPILQVTETGGSELLAVVSKWKGELLVEVVRGSAPPFNPLLRQSISRFLLLFEMHAGYEDFASSCAASMKEPHRLLFDDQWCIAVAKSDSITGMATHIDVEYHYIQHKERDNLMTFEYMLAPLIAADVFAINLSTKKLSNKFSLICTAIDTLFNLDGIMCICGIL